MVAAEGGDLDLRELVAHQHDAEVRAHAAGPREQVHDAVGAGVGGDVVVLRLAPEQQVAHTSADQPGLVAGRA